MSNNIKFKYNYRAYIFYLVMFLMYILLNFASSGDDVLSIALFYALAICGYNLFISFFLFNISFLYTQNVELWLCAFVISSFLLCVFLTYKICKKKPRAQSLVFVAIALCYFIFNFAKTDVQYSVVVSVIILAFCVVSQIFLFAFTKKMFRCALRPDELVCIAVFFIMAASGILKLFNLDIYKAIFVYCLLMSCIVAPSGSAMLVALCFAAPLSIEYLSLSYIGLFCSFAFICVCFAKTSKIFCALSVLLIELCCAFYFNFYQSYGLNNFLYVLVSCAAFVLTPQALIKKLQKLTLGYREKHLVKTAISRNRLTITNKLFEISNVFKELEAVFLSARSALIGEEQAIKCVVTEVEESICAGCENINKCDMAQVKCGLNKLLKVGMTKGKVNIVDLPIDITYNCTRPNNIIFAVNKLLADYRTHLIEAKNSDDGRDMIASQASGIAEILKALALENSKVLNFEKELEKKLTQTFYLSGIIPSEVLIYGDGCDISISAVLATDVPTKLITKIVTEIAGREMILNEKLLISSDKCAYTFRKMPPLDAVFGVAMAAKEGNAESGDTYSVVRLSEDKFLIALSDGMGAGNNAHVFSSTAMTLIEGFFKTGMNTDLILHTVNKVLNFNKEENYACLDIALIDLTCGEAGLIKIGAPFGFILSGDQVKMVESDSLPLGILQTLQPTIYKQHLAPGDLVVLISDGVSLAFGSSSDLFDFIKTLGSQNPQTLCDEILNEAIRLYGGKRQDDMTVLATRIFLKSA